MFKRVSKILVIFLILSLSFFIMSSCDLKDAGKPQSEDGFKNILIIVGETEYTVSTDKEYLHDLLVQMKDESQIEYDFTISSYGAYVTKVGSVEENLATNTYITIYHDIDDVTLRGDLGEWPMANKTYKDKTYYSSSVGISLMPIYDGHKYLITTITY